MHRFRTLTVALALTILPFPLLRAAPHTATSSPAESAVSGASSVQEPDDWNDRWWKYVGEFQGVEAPSKRGEKWADYSTKTHINDTPAYYYNYAFATVLKFQLHDYIARKILHQPPQSCNYAGNKEVGKWLNSILEKGGTEDWRKVLKEATGEDLSTRAMVEYFQPLMAWLEEQNKGRKIGWEDDKGENPEEKEHEEREHREHQESGSSSGENNG